MTKRFGFTLAEVLITLGIIGVVAAMTIPTLINGTNNTQFKTGYKKIMSTLNQAVTMNLALDNTDFSGLNVTTTAAGDLSLYNLFNNRMNVISTSVAATAGGIMTTGGASNYTLFFNDGMAISFPQAAKPSLCPGATTAVSTANCTILVDVNGAKKPNQLTASTTSLQDQFAVKIDNQEVRPSGIYTGVLFN